MLNDSLIGLNDIPSILFNSKPFVPNSVSSSYGVTNFEY